ncbi:MAG: hypothetical protein ACK5O7_06270 [Holosporales bacterium]
MRKILFTLALFNSISAMASDLPELEDVKAGLTSAPLTIDIDSEAAYFYRKDASTGENEENLLRAVQLGHGFAARLLVKQFGENNPTYRELLLRTTLKKLEGGFIHGLEDDMRVLGHDILFFANMNLDAILSSKNNIHRNFYIASLKWKELGPYVKGAEKEEDPTELTQKARDYLATSAADGSLEAKCMLAALAVQEHNPQQAFTELFDDQLLADLKKRSSKSNQVNATWSQAVKDFIHLVGDSGAEQQLLAYRFLGELHHAARKYEVAFDYYFTAYKKAHQLNFDSEDRFALFTQCNECILAQKKFITEEINTGRLRYLGYELHSFMAEQAEKMGDEKAFQESQSVALGHLKEAILAGYTEPLKEILEQCEFLFPSLSMAVQFLEEIVTGEYEKELSSRMNYGGRRAYEAFKNHGRPVKESLENKLLALFTQVEDSEIALKYSIVKSLIMLQGDFDYLLERNTPFGSLTTAKLHQKNDAPALFFRDNKNVIQFMRSLDLECIPSKDKAWAHNTIAQLNAIYENGIRYEENRYYTNSRGWIDYSKSADTRFAYIIEPETKEN